jgi:hypothetical protein
MQARSNHLGLYLAADRPAHGVHVLVIVYSSSCAALWCLFHGVSSPDVLLFDIVSLGLHA